MASTFSDLGIELMATGENAGTWGTKTNTNLQIVEKAIAGYVEKSIAGGAQTTALTITDGDTTESTSVARHAVIKLTGTITGNQIVTVPDSIEKVYLVVNGTSGSFTVQFKTASGTGVTFGSSNKGTKLVFSDGTNIVDANFGGATDLDGGSLTLDADADTTITADTDDQIDIAIAGADDFRFTANTFTALSGSSVVIPDGGLTLGSTAVTSTAAELNILDGVTSTAAELNILDGVTSTAAELNILDGVTSTAAELNLLDGITAGTVSASLAVIVDSNKDISGFRNLSITGDLTVAGDDITMGTNTAGNLLIADGTNFNSIAIGSLSEISTVANDDVFLAVDTSGGGLKKIARSAIVSGLATSGAISNVVEDSTPQLGGNLDMNGNDIVTTSNADIELAANGTGKVVVKGNTNQGAIQFNCEANSHGQIVIAAPHSESASNTLTLPSTGGDARLVSTSSTATLTNKTLTTPVIAEIDNSSDITLDAGADIILDAGGGDFNFKDDGTEILRISNSSSDVIIRPVVDAKDLIFQQRDGTEVARIEDNGTFNIVTDKLAINGTAVTSTAAELNILDGVTSTATELNLIDGGATVGTTAVADGDGIIHNDGGTMRVTSAATFKTYFTSGVSSAADDLTAGDAAVNLTTTSGNITIDAQDDDSDIILKGTDGGADTTFLTIDGSAAGEATFNAGIVIADAGNIGSASDKDAIAIASNGVVTFSQAPVFPDGSIAIADLDIDGGTDIGADLVDADLFIVDDGAGGTNRKVAASRIKTYIGGGTQWQAIKTSNYTASAGQGVFANTTSGAFTVTLPASPSLGDEVTIVDYAGTADTNNITVGRNSSPIMGEAEDLTIAIERAGITLVYVDSTQGWLLKDK